jgi:4-nitrophenyl phosphatase
MPSPPVAVLVIRGVVLDVDGTVVRGNDPLPGAQEGVETIRRAGLPIIFCSNNPTKGAAAYVDRLESAGFAVEEAEIVTAAIATRAYLQRHHAGETVYVFGEESVREQIERADVTLVDDPDAAAVVVASIDYDFGYADMKRAIGTVDAETTFLGTDPDPVIPAADGDVPGSGAIVNALAGVVGRDPDAIPGKPSETILELVRERLAVDPSELLVVGDRLDTDIELGERAGATTALVTTGVTDREEIAASDHDPDYVLDSLAELGDVLKAEDDED